VINSPLGKGFLAIRDNDLRASLIGLNVYVLRLTAFVMAGFLAGVDAHSMLVLQTPSKDSFPTSPRGSRICWPGIAPKLG